MHSNVHCSTVYNSKDREPTQMSINDRLDRENVAHIRHWNIMQPSKMMSPLSKSFVGTWMNLENINFSKLTQEQKIKHCMFSLIGGCWTIRTHGHREGSITHWGLLGGNRGGTAGGGELGRDSMGRMPDIGEGEEGSKSHCHVCTYATILHVLHMYPQT